MTFTEAIHMRKVLLLCVGPASPKTVLFTKIIFASPLRSLLLRPSFLGSEDY